MKQHLGEGQDVARAGGRSARPVLLRLDEELERLLVVAAEARERRLVAVRWSASVGAVDQIRLRGERLPVGGLVEDRAGAGRCDRRRSPPCGRGPGRRWRGRGRPGLRSRPWGRSPSSRVGLPFGDAGGQLVRQEVVRRVVGRAGFRVAGEAESRATPRGRRGCSLVDQRGGDPADRRRDVGRRRPCGRSASSS